MPRCTRCPSPSWYGEGIHARNLFEPAADVLRVIDAVVDPGDFLADRDRSPVKLRQDRKDVPVRHVIADKEGAPTGEWRVGHQLAYRRALVESGILDLD